MKYYSQCKQDKFFNEVIFKSKRNGVFVDIGANDGITFSNTYFFEKELDWKGLCIEPLEETFKKLQFARKCMLVNGCAASFNGTEIFFDVKGYGEMLSGLKSKYDPRHLKRLYKDVEEHGGSFNEIQMQCYEVNELLKKHKLFYIDFMSIDTEGGELEILKAIDFKAFNIKALTIENPFKYKELEKFMISKNFEKVKTLDVDEIFVNKNEYNFFKRIQFRRFNFF